LEIVDRALNVDADLSESEYGDEDKEGECIYDSLWIERVEPEFLDDTDGYYLTLYTRFDHYARKQLRLTWKNLCLDNDITGGDRLQGVGQPTYPQAAEALLKVRKAIESFGFQFPLELRRSVLRALFNLHHRAVDGFVQSGYYFDGPTISVLLYGSVPPPPIPFPEPITEEIEELETEYFWNHITISRDQTASSNFQKELLIILSTLGAPTDRAGRAEIGYSEDPDPTSRKLFFKSPNGLRRAQEPPINLAGRTPVHEPIGNIREAAVSSPKMVASRDERLSRKDSQSGIIQPSISRKNTANTIESGSVHELLNRISLLESENDQLKEGPEESIEVEVLYFINESREVTAYLDEPTWAFGLRGKVALRSHFPIPDVDGYMQQKRNVAFYIAKSYNQEHQKEEVQRAAREKRQLPRPEPVEETMRLESQAMIEAMEAFIRAKPSFETDFPGFDVRLPFRAPYLFWFHHRSPNALEGLSDRHHRYMSKLSQWIDDKYGAMYSRVTDQLARGVVSYESVQFLMKPGDAVVVNSKPGQDGGDLSAKITATWPVSTTPRHLVEAQRDFVGSNRRKGDKRFIWKWYMTCWTWEYDGSFFKRNEEIEIKILTEKVDGEVDIRNLNAYPMKFATAETVALLEQRGRTFWSCRDRRLVAYEDRKGLYGVWVRLPRTSP
jgi:hypothetical protein